jgi:hypothetical protein
VTIVRAAVSCRDHAESRRFAQRRHLIEQTHPARTAVMSLPGSVRGAVVLDDLRMIRGNELGTSPKSSTGEPRSCITSVTSRSASSSRW